MKSGFAKHLGVALIQQQNGLVKGTNVTLLVKVHCFLIQSGLSKCFTGIWVSIKVGNTKKLSFGSGVDTGLVQVLQGVDFEVKPQEDHTFEVESHENVDHVAGSQEVQTQDLIYYHLARNREQHSTHELFSYREYSNEVAFAVAEAEKIFAHELLTFKNTVACEAEIWATKGLLDKAKGNVFGIDIVRDQSGNTLRVSQSKFYNEKLVQTLLEGHSILSLEGSLSGDCDVQKNGKWSCIYAVGSQGYQMVCTRLDIASTDVRVCWISLIVDYRQTYSGVYDTYGGCKGGYLAKETRNRVRIRAKDSSGYCYRRLFKGYPSPRL
nr:retrovirus-related Pol polyprotein from transposon TNT 1-94 [Tanacetum cinerariifolium]